MRLFALRNRTRPVIAGGGLVLRAPEPDDFGAWLALRTESRDFLVPWEPRWPADDLSRAGYRRRLDRYHRDALQATAYTWFLLREADNALLGGLTLSNIRAGAARSCQLGYWMGERHAGKGYMSRAVKLALAEAFGPMGLERVEAACLPHNERSVRLLEGAGFQREGHLRSYLEIDGRRQDHLLYSILRREFLESGAWPSRQERNVAPMSS